MKKIILIAITLIINLHLNGQNDTTKLIINLTPLDYKYQLQASKIYSPAETFFSPSMQQSLDITTSTYNLTFYTLDQINWDFVRNPILRPLAQTMGFYTVIIGLTFFPFGDSWLHEEFHRSILTYHQIKSHDQVYDFPIFSELISVNNVQDTDLVSFKANYPHDFIRLHEAGIEGEYLLINRLNELSFFNGQNYPYFIPGLLIALNDFYYVWFCHTLEAENITNQLNQTEINILDRDFTGLDFTAWVYDLFRPDEPYTDRGIHPSGQGIDRYRKPSDLTGEELAYLKRQGYMQLINFLSPFLLNVKGFNIGQTRYNFAFRYFLTSFGTDLAIYNYLQHNKLNLVIGTHLYKNYYNVFPGLEIHFMDYNLWSNKLFVSSDIQVFTQPKDFNFTTASLMFGLSTNTQISIKIHKHIHIRLGILAKSKGWVPGVVQQDKAFNILASISYRH